ncbi:MAG: molybdopterin-dependent oxidoreductase [Streptosporangiales bacterium]|nr:molybdopterin-dependent oxidoreductase [Streptosporangiales bacterium]
MSILGTRVVRSEDPKLLTAGGTYADDLREPALNGALYATYVRSPMAHARITGIDVSAALESPGVVAVYTGADCDLDPAPPAPEGALGGKPHPSMARPFLAKDVVRFVGEPVALVLTEKRAQGEDAIELVAVDYDPLPAVIDLDDALSGTNLVFPEAGSNVVGVGGADAADAQFADCEAVVTATLENQRVAAAPLEVRSAAAAWGDDGRVTVWLSTQNAQGARDALQGALGLDEGKVRIITPDVGGGFGAKIGIDPEGTALAWASKRVGRPLRWTESRTENMLAMTHGRAQRHKITIGGDRDGRVKAYRIEVVQDLGAYPGVASFLPALTMLMASGVYDIASVTSQATIVVTNKMVVAAYRGAGRPEATAAIERAMDLFAAEVGMDPADVRRKNFIKPDAFPYTTPGGAMYDTGEYEKALDAVLESAGYAQLREEQARRRAAGETLQLGLGLSTYVEITAPDFSVGEDAKVEVHDDGTATIYTGSSPHGQGHLTAFGMLVQDKLGIPLEKIKLVHGDTDQVPKGGGTMGSRSLQLGGSAVYRAAEDVLEKGRKLAAELIEIDEGDLVLDKEAGRFHVAGQTGTGVSWGELAAAAREQGGLAADCHFAEDLPTFPFGTHLAVAEVDVETGQSRLLRHITVDDAGTILNPVLTEGQRHGGIAQGAAQALFEVMYYDPDGNPQTANFADYAIPAASELPSFELLSQETPTTLNPLGAKGIGEAGTIGSTPAVQNAVVDAVAHLGVRHIDMPTTPQRVWQAINEG